MKKTFLALAFITFSTTSCAQLTPNEVVGGVIGGLAGSTIGGGNGRVAAAAAGAVLGANVGRQVPSYGYVQGYAVPAPVVVSRGYPPGTYPVYVYGSDGTYPIYERNMPCQNEAYIDGVYNPPAAQAYCRGRLEREYHLQRQYERSAYERGLNGRPADRGYLR